MSPEDAPTARVPRSERDFRWALGAITLVGLWCRLAALSRGSLFRDDAWVALTRRVPLHEAWHMVGTAPGFTLLEREWTALTQPSTLLAQLPTLGASLAAIIAVGLAARYVGLGRGAALGAAALVAIGPISAAYATHLKPYASDELVAALVLVAAERYRRGGSAWPLALVGLLGVALSFSVAPVVLGAAAVVVALGVRRHRTRELVAPGLVAAVPLALLYLAARKGISPRLTRSWSANFVNWHSLHGLVHSIVHIIDGLLWGFVETTPHWHVPGLSKLVIVATILAVLVGAFTSTRRLPATAGLVAAAILAGAHVAPLGTGRTDAYLYPALAVLAAGGLEAAVGFATRWRRAAGRIVLAGAVAVVGFLGADIAAHRPTYPGGSIDPVAADAREVLGHHGAVLIEGTARWPWTYYEVHRVRLVFSGLYNTGFAPLSDQRAVVIMRGTDIEGGYDPAGAVARVERYSEVLYVRTDDWPGLGDPLARAFAVSCFVPVRHAHPPGYLVEWLTRTCSA